MKDHGGMSRHWGLGTGVEEEQIAEERAAQTETEGRR